MSKSKEISIVLCGEAGQGIKTLELALTRILKFAGFHVFATKEVMSRIRGGANSTEIRVSSERVTSYVDCIDLLIPLNKGAAQRQEYRLSKDTIVLGEKESVEEVRDKVEHVYEIPFTDMAKEAGNKLYSNIIAAGVVCGIMNVETEVMNDFIGKKFASKKEEIVKANLEAAQKGYEKGQELRSSGKVDLQPEKGGGVSDELLLSGVEAVSMGAIAGGCDFVSSYPMSPSTGVLVFLAGRADEFGIVVEQAEDEIAAVNMAVGAWYAGARAVVTTSGGGFALMEEGISLAGILETPLVIHLAQRPGPATGLPTRTEQGDLELAIYAGHGEFPRIVLAPGDIKDSFFIMHKALDMADKFQSPVFVLTDQYLLNSYYNIPELDASKIKPGKHIVKTEADYKRYKITENGISPRGIPGYGSGIVCADSDEHTEEGYITEDLIDVRVNMVEKRLKKMNAILEDSVPPELAGSENYKNLLVGWGSTLNVVKEALEEIGREDLSFLHFKQVHPLPPETRKYLEKAEKVITIENNATGQFAKILKLNAGREPDDQILKYNGLPFSKEEVVSKIKDIL